MGAGTSQQGLKDAALGFVGGVTACAIMGYGLYYLWNHLSWFWIILIVGGLAGIFVYDYRVKERKRQALYKRMESYDKACAESREREKEQGSVNTDCSTEN